MNAGVEVCKNNTASYTDLGIFSEQGVHKVSYSSTFDISGQLSKFEKYGTLSVYLSKSVIDSLGSDLTWAGNIRIDLVAANGDTLMIVNSAVNPDLREIDLNPNASIDLVKYIQEGKISLIYTLTGTAPESFRVNVQNCFDVKAESDKNTGDIPK